jgi:hypothetical protein
MNTCTLTLSEEERAALVGLLEQSLLEVHAERRRTESPRYQEAVTGQEALLRRLAEKLQNLQPAVG